MSSYQQSKRQAFYSMISQKISQKLDSLPQIDCVSERWIWELIQNAKDAGSEFDRIKIKIDIFDDRLKISHNGNPFILENLDSLAYHFSAKDDENKEDLQTTGKYGTGFMVTYVVSKKVRLDCKFKGYPEIDDDSSDQNQQEVKLDDVKVQQNCVTNVTTNKEKIKKAKLQKLRLQGGFYQDLSILLDRSYDHVKELKQKLAKLDKSIAKQLKNAPKLQKYVRTEESFDTNFTYEDLDDAALDHINAGVLSIKRLFPLTLLFNRKLFSIQVMNHSTKLPNLLSFEIVRQTNMHNPLKFGLLSVFTAAIYENITYDMLTAQKDKCKRTQQYIYQQNTTIHSIIAFPVEIVNNKINLLRFPSGFPKIFKEFPLLGCQDVGFNFAFTSKEFYPSENRKQLLLKQLEGRTGNKAQINWKIINQIFSQANELYSLLISQLQKGKFNLFVIPQGNQFTKSPHQSKKFIQKINKIKNTVFQAKMFAINKKKYSFSEIQIIYDSNSPKIASQMYDLFSMLISLTLSKQDYEQFCEVASINKIFNQLKYCIKKPLLTLQKCVNLLADKKFKFLETLYGTQKALAHLQKIYYFLIKQNNNLFESKPIILTQCMAFQQLNLSSIPINLQIEVDFQNKKQLFDIAIQFNIPLKNFLIHQRYNHIFQAKYQAANLQKINNSKQKYYYSPATKINSLLSLKFEKYYLLKRINGYFKSLQACRPTQSNVYDEKSLIILGRYLNSFASTNIQTLKQAAKFKNFQSICVPLCFPIIPGADSTTIDSNSSLCTLFSKDFFTISNLIYKTSKSIDAFTGHIVNNDKQFAISYIYFLLNSSGYTLQYLPNADEQIVQTPLKQLQEGFQLLSPEDIQIYDIFYEKCNKVLSFSLKSLRKTLIHPLVVPRKSSPFSKITFQSLFSCICTYYNMNTSTLQDKEVILNYTFNIYEEYLIKGNKSYEVKYKTFAEIINKRHLEFGKLLDSLNDEDKDFICKIFKMKDKFRGFNEIISNYGVQEILATMRRVRK